MLPNPYRTRSVIFEHFDNSHNHQDRHNSIGMHPPTESERTTTTSPPHS